MPSFLVLGRICHRSESGADIRQPLERVFEGTREEVIDQIRAFDIEYAKAGNTVRFSGPGAKTPFKRMYEKRWLEVERIIEIVSTIDPTQVLNGDHIRLKTEAIKDHLNQAEAVLRRQLAEEGIRLASASASRIPDPEDVQFTLTKEEIGDPSLQAVVPELDVFNSFVLTGGDLFRLHLGRDFFVQPGSFVVEPLTGTNIPLNARTSTVQFHKPDKAGGYGFIDVIIDAMEEECLASIKIRCRDDGLVLLDVQTMGPGGDIARGSWAVLAYKSDHGVPDADARWSNQFLRRRRSTVAQHVWNRLYHDLRTTVLRHDLSRHVSTIQYPDTIASHVDDFEARLWRQPHDGALSVLIADDHCEAGMETEWYYAETTILVGTARDALRAVRGAEMARNVTGDLWAGLIRASMLAEDRRAVLSEYEDRHRGSDDFTLKYIVTFGDGEDEALIAQGHLTEANFA